MTRPGSRIVALVPVRGLEGAKSRLGEVLDAEERRDLVVALLERTIAAASAAASITEVLVISPDPAALALATSAGGRGLHQTGSGLNGALAEARADAVAHGASAVLVLPGDLPEVTPGAIDAVVEAANPGTRGDDDVPAGDDVVGGDVPAIVVLVTDRHRRGTNALLLEPPGVIPFAFGGDSRAAHAALARAAGARYVELAGPLELDLDTAEDLLLAEVAGRSGPTEGARHGA